VIDGAEELLNHLGDLLDSSDLDEFSSQLATMVAAGRSADGDRTALADAETAIVQLVSTHESTRQWLQNYIDMHFPAALRIYSPPPPGEGEPAIIPSFRCPIPKCAFTWHRDQLGVSVPKCPIHHIDLQQL